MKLVAEEHQVKLSQKHWGTTVYTIRMSAIEHARFILHSEHTLKTAIEVYLDDNYRERLDWLRKVLGKTVWRIRILDKKVAENEDVDVRVILVDQNDKVFIGRHEAAKLEKIIHPGMAI